MQDTRRLFMKRLAGMAGSWLAFQASPPIPHPRKRIEIDPPTGEDKADNAAESGPTSMRRVRLQQQEREFRATMDRLYVRVGDLKTQVDGLQSKEVFSVAVFKQTQEIEKLAKQLKSYARS